MKNQGMFLEAIINKTNQYFLRKQIAIIHKRNLLIHISQINQNRVKGFLGPKSYVDYYGYYNNVVFEFEAKSTKKDYFLLNNIKPHQHRYLLLAKKMGAKVFLILYFYGYKKFIFLDYQYVLDWKDQGKNKISYDLIIKKGKEILISFPGIINFLKFIK